MNIIKLQDQLKGLPDQTLAGYVQNPTGEVPTYLALSELQRRKTMREKYQQQQAPQTTVAEDLAAPPPPMQQGIASVAPQQMQAPMPAQAPQGMAQGGVAALDTGDMYNENSFASGGIVAFADGGATSKIGDFFRGLGNPAALDIDKQIGMLQAEKNKIQMDIFSSYTPEQRAAQQQKLSEIDSQLADLSAKRSGSAPAQASTPNAPIATPGGPRVDSTQLPQSITGIGSPSQFQPSPNALSAMTPPQGGQDAGPANVPGAGGMGGLYQPLPDYSAEYAKLHQDPAGAAEAGMDKYRTMIGTDTMRPQLEEKLKKMEERSTKQEEQAPWMALARAGLGMAAGKSRYALQNIAEGATMGMEDYAKAKDKFETAREKQFDIQAKLSQAKRAEDIAAATYGLKSEETIKAQNHSDKLAELSYKYTRDAANQKNKIDAYEATSKDKYYSALGDASSNKEDSFKTLYNNYLEGKFIGQQLPEGLTYEQFKQKVNPGIPSDINGLVNKWAPPKK
jgi:hypothetical protein